MSIYSSYTLQSSIAHYATSSKIFDNRCAFPQDYNSLRNYFLNSSDKCLKSLSDSEKLKLLLLLYDSDFDDEFRTTCLTRLYKFLNFSDKREEHYKTLMSRFCNAIFPSIAEWEKDWDKLSVDQKIEIAKSIHAQLIRIFKDSDTRLSEVEWMPTQRTGSGVYLWNDFKTVLFNLDQAKIMGFSNFIFTLVGHGINHLQNLQFDTVKLEKLRNAAGGNEQLNMDDALVFFSINEKGAVDRTKKGAVTPIGKEAEMLAKYCVQQLQTIGKNIVSTK